MSLQTQPAVVLLSVEQVLLLLLLIKLLKLESCSCTYNAFSLL